MRNPRPALPNRNSLYLGRSGSGKSQALKQNPIIMPGSRVALWDPNEDHPCQGYATMSAFIAALTEADRISKGRMCGFRIGYTGPDTMAAYLLWCKAVSAILDGRVFTHLIAEELSTVSSGTGKAPLPAVKLLNQCRKYGGIFHGTSQKPQEINKTYFDQCENLWIGAQKTLRQRRIVAEEIGVDPKEIGQLQPLQFYHDDGRTVTLKRLRYVG